MDLDRISSRNCFDKTQLTNLTSQLVSGNCSGPNDLVACREPTRSAGNLHPSQEMAGGNCKEFHLIPPYWPGCYLCG